MNDHETFFISTNKTINNFILIQTAHEKKCAGKKKLTLCSKATKRFVIPAYSFTFTQIFYRPP